jgi:hypothetical protein
LAGKRRSRTMSRRARQPSLDESNYVFGPNRKMVNRIARSHPEF